MMRIHVSVNSYIQKAPRGIQIKLKQLRNVIRKTIPNATEKMSYGMPYYSFHGRLAYFSFTKNHIGLYIPPPIIEKHAIELKRYSTSRATIRFPLSIPLPTPLIRRLIKSRARMNVARS